MLRIALIAALCLAASGRSLTQTKSTSGGCEVIDKTYLSGTYLSRYSELATADDCCKRCSNTPQCELWAYCPASTGDTGCFTGGSYEVAAACTLYSLDGVKPTVEQQGPQTTWISGSPKKLPSIPDAKPGICAPYPNTMLVAEYLRRTEEEDEAACCSRCNNNPECDVWSYCATDPEDKCFTTSGNEYGTACILYSLNGWDGEGATVEQQGPETLWVTGYRDPDSPYEVPDVNATAPDGCIKVLNTLLVTDTRLGSFDDLQDASVCCERCRNTPDCGLWSFCSGDAGETCYAAFTTYDAGRCQLFAITPDPTAETGNDVRVDQRGAETAWTSGFKWAEDNTFPGEPPKAVSCSTTPNSMTTGSGLGNFYEIPTAAACCARCTNTPDCRLWTYCPASEKDGCFSPSGDQDPGTCHLYTLGKGEKPEVQLEGADTPWVSGQPQA